MGRNNNNKKTKHTSLEKISPMTTHGTGPNPTAKAEMYKTTNDKGSQSRDANNLLSCIIK